MISRDRVDGIVERGLYFFARQTVPIGLPLFSLLFHIPMHPKQPFVRAVFEQPHATGFGLNRRPNSDGNDQPACA
jgi:hypothetical protein